MLSAIFEQCVEESPVSVMARGLMERVFEPERMDRLFEKHAVEQYQQELLFSSQVDLMNLVVCGIHPSVHAAYRAHAAFLSVSTTALYNKLCGIQPGVSQALVRETAKELHLLVQAMNGEQENLLPGYQLKIVDGTSFAATERRLDVIRTLAARALPGKAIAVLDPSSKLVIDMFPMTDGHAQERSLFSDVLETVQPLDVWNGDRNFCTANFMFTIARKKAFERDSSTWLSWMEIG